MSLRLRLLLSFAAGELLLLLFFGFTAYDTAKLTSLNGEIQLLSSMTPHIAAQYEEHIKSGHKIKTVLVPDKQAGKNDAVYLIVSNTNGDIIESPNSLEISNVYQKIVENLSSDPEPHLKGSLVLNKTTYIWSRASAQTSETILTLIRMAHVSNANKFFREMGVSLIVAAVILLWVASWAAMYVAMLIEKLDEQKNILKHRSLHDVLTGLPNRALLHDRLHQLVKSYNRSHAQFFVCFIDLNRFKDVNDTLGHHIGDELLLEIGKRLRAQLRQEDTVSRLGGDEFALILQNTNAASAKIICEKLLKEIEVPVLIGSHKLFISGSFGIACFPEQSEDVQTLLRKADVAMYAAKRTGTSIEFYSDELEVFSQQKLALTHDLREAIENDALQLYYQPKYNVSTKKVVGIEALLRWNHPEHGFIPPLDFIPLAEHSGLIYPLSMWVMNRAFQDSLKLNENSIDFTIAINISAHFLQDIKFEKDIHNLIHQTGVSPANIILELTESAMFINSAKIKSLLNRITEMGFRISVDDFGTGYSTLTNLRRLPISELKIDRSFVKKIVTDAEDASIVDAMIGLGGSLDIEVVAEGVETEEVLKVLRKFGCDTIQGYLISKPAPLEEFVAWLKDSEKQHLKQIS
jgi:diguanylate cyclase (GGDEF)-like protein